MMENMIMDQVLGSSLLRKLQAVQSQPYDNHQQTGCNNYIDPNPSLSDIHMHDHIHHDALLTKQTRYQPLGHRMLPPSSSPPSQDAAVVNYLLANSAFPYTICKKEEKEEEEDLMLVSSLPSCDTLLGSRHSLLSTNDTHDFDNSYNTQLLHYASGCSGRYSSDLSSSYNTPLAEHVQCSIDPSPISGRYTSQASLAYTSEEFSCLLRQSMKDEANCLGIDVQECNVKEVNKDASCSLSCMMNANNPHLALSTSSSSTPTSMTSGLTCHANLQANWMTFDDNYNSNNPISNYHNNDKLLHMNNMVNNGDHNGVSASITSHEKKKKRKRKRTSHKNVQEMESQRMTHIAVERNRRKQMNEHLRALRMLMPHSYIQRGDQASIVGGTIRFVEELEQVLQALQLQKQLRSLQEYKIMNAKLDGNFGACMGHMHKLVDPHVEEAYASTRSCMANVEVTMMTSSTIFVKILAQKRPQQLLHTLLALTSLSLKVIQLNITATELIILYCFNLEMEDDCQLHTSNELAESIQHIFCM